eukprot:1145754-Pelagomonas_calceolata.AAC.3
MELIRGQCDVLAIGDNCLGIREYGGTQVKMQFIKQLSSRRVRERCCGTQGQLNTKHHAHMVQEHAKLPNTCNVATLEFNALEAKLQPFEDRDTLCE